MNIDLQYPKLGALVREVLNLSLHELAKRAPASAFTFFDLERLLAHAELIGQTPLNEIEESLFRLHHQQTLGYVSTLEAFVALDIVEDRESFVVKKLLAPREALPTPPSSEMLDTLAECSWGLWLHDQHNNVIAEKKFPADAGDADFFTSTTDGDRWVDCISLAPADAPARIGGYLASRVRAKWGKKFGARPSAAKLPAAIAVMLLKGQEHLMPGLILNDVVGRRYEAPSSLWTDCPGLVEVWIGLPSWDARAQRPELLATWKRPAP